MRSRKLAGLVVGALAAGVMVAPGLVAPAQAAPTTQTETVQLSCTFGNFKIAYPAEVELEVDGTAVSATLSDIPPTGMPAFLKVHGSAAAVDATVNGEAVELNGAVTYGAPVTNNPPIELPEVTGTRTGTADLTGFSITAIDVTMTVQAGGPNTSLSEMPCAPVAPVVVEQDLTCKFGNFDIAYPAEVSLIANGTGVSATLSDIPPTGMPAFLKVHGSSAVVDATVDGEAVELSGSVTYPAPVTNNPSIALPAVSGTRTATAATTAVSIQGVDVTMTVQAGGPNTSLSEMSCAPVVPPVELTVTQNLTCVFDVYSIPYTAQLTSSVSGTAVTGTLTQPFAPGMPAFVTVSKLSAALNTTIDGAAVTLSGSDSYDPARAGNGSFTMPALTGTRATATAPSAIAITGAVLTVTAMGADNVINCTPAAAVNPTATATTLAGSSPAAAQVALSAKVTPTTAAGTIEFYEGTTKVGQAAAAAGAASATLTNVAAGAHSYTAKFVPTSTVAFTGSTSTVVKVTVAAPGPSAACTTATANAKAAQTKVKTAEAKVKKSKAKVKKAQAKVKKAAKVKTAKGKKQLKAAKKALKTAKAKLKSDTKKVSTAKKALTTATNAVKAAC